MIPLFDFVAAAPLRGSEDPIAAKFPVEANLKKTKKRHG